MPIKTRVIKDDATCGAVSCHFRPYFHNYFFSNLNQLIDVHPQNSTTITQSSQNFQISEI